MEQEPQARVEEKTQEFSSAARYHFFRKILISTLQYINCFFYIHIKNNLLQIKSAQDPYLHWKYRFIQNCAQKVVFQNQNFTPQNFDLRRVSVFFQNSVSKSKFSFTHVVIAWHAARTHSHPDCFKQIQINFQNQNA